ncbi:MAG: hypothetical protein QOG23_1843 [Blastocatellia bacterium]|jgi:hypothetical protein|nr:hypothetical protein [Blastocatellia bacterium]
MAMVLLSLIPQINLWVIRGRDWNGAYATLQGDEFLYSAYVNALIDGRPRRTDPFAGQDSTPQLPLPESSFSTQFLPAYALALPARGFGISASTIFIILMGLAGLLSSLSLYWLLGLVTGDKKVAAFGVVLVLCCGALAGGQGIVGVLFGQQRSAFVPFLRRYQPAVVFPLFFVFCALVWKMLVVDRKRLALLCSALAGLTFAVLVFSYLYLWTAALAWFVSFALFWIFLRPRTERWSSVMVLSLTTVIAVFSFIPYAVLVSHRSASLAEAQILVRTHQIDPFHIPEMIGAILLAAIIVAIRLGRIKRREPRVIFALSLAVLPLVLFNQQILTGRSIQPVHFDYYAANYAVLISLAIVMALLWQPIPNRALVWIAALCFSWGILEVGLLVSARTAPDAADDQTIPVLMRLKELAKVDGTLIGLRSRGNASVLVFSPRVDVMRILPTWSSQRTLLAAGAQDFGTATRKERQELLYEQLYFSEVDGARFREFLNHKTDDTYMNFYAPSVMFGDDRFLSIFSLHSRPIQQDEIEEAVRDYQAYVDSFSREKALHHPITYLVTSVKSESNLSHIDRWYQRDAGERLGDYNLFRIKMRS